MNELNLAIEQQKKAIKELTALNKQLKKQTKVSFWKKLFKK